MQNTVPGRRIEVVTAVMLGLVSVVTALGAWQAALWMTASDNYQDKTRDARDASITLGVIANYAQRVDRAAGARARQYFELTKSADPEVAGFNEIALKTALGDATPGFSDAWLAWATAGYPADTDPLQDPDYLMSRDGAAASASYTSTVAGAISDEYRAKADLLNRAALIQAVALFLFGIAGVNRNQAVRSWILALGVVVFLVGLIVATTAF